MEKIFLEPDEIKKMLLTGRGYFGGGISGGICSLNPSSNDIIADTNPLTPGIYDVDFYLSATVDVAPTKVRLGLYHEDGISYDWEFGFSCYRFDVAHVHISSFKVTKKKRFRIFMGSNPTSGYYYPLISYTRIFPLEKGD